jgi:hypothetical protein
MSIVKWRDNRLKSQSGGSLYLKDAKRNSRQVKKRTPRREIDNLITFYAWVPGCQVKTMYSSQIQSDQYWGIAE